MKTVFFIVPMFFLFFLSLPIGQVQATDFAIETASDHIDITVGFNGSSIELFGDRREKDTDVAIVVEGPEKDVTIWKKGRVMGTWINMQFVKFDNASAYYNYALSTQNVDEELAAVFLENGIGHDAFFKKIEEKTSRKLENTEEFKEAFLKKKKALGIFFEEPAEMKFITDNFFRVSFDIPASAPTGNYKIRSFLIRNGKVLEENLNLIKVEQVGLNALVYRSSRDYSLIYAITCIFLAMFSGWLVSVLRVKP